MLVDDTILPAASPTTATVSGVTLDAGAAVQADRAGVHSDRVASAQQLTRRPARGAGAGDGAGTACAVTRRSAGSSAPKWTPRAPRGVTLKADWASPRTERRNRWRPRSPRGQRASGWRPRRASARPAPSSSTACVVAASPGCKDGCRACSACLPLRRIRLRKRGIHSGPDQT